MRNSELRNVPRPQRFKMICQTNLPTSIHLRRFPIQFGQFNLRSGHRVHRWNLNKKPQSKQPYSTYNQQLTSNLTSNSYFNKSCIYQHFPNHFVPSLFDSKRNQSLSASLLFLTYWNFQTYGFRLWDVLIELRLWITSIRARYSSLSLCVHSSLSLGPAFVLRSGILLILFLVLSSTIFLNCQNRKT